MTVGILGTPLQLHITFVAQHLSHTPFMSPAKQPNPSGVGPPVGEPICDMGVWPPPVILA
jgi:hypothetical protein